MCDKVISNSAIFSWGSSFTLTAFSRFASTTTWNILNFRALLFIIFLFLYWFWFFTGLFFCQNRLSRFLNENISIEFIIRSFLIAAYLLLLRFLFILLLLILNLLTLFLSIINDSGQFGGRFIVHINPKLIAPTERGSSVGVFSSKSLTLFTTLDLKHFNFSIFLFTKALTSIN